MIILDTNVLPRDGKLTGATFVLLKTIATQTGQKLAIPKIVLEESVAGLQRDIEAALVKAQAAAAELGKIFEGYPAPEVDAAERVSQWRQHLNEYVEILDAPDSAAESSLFREAWRLAPARESGGRGVGARDAFLWLTVLDTHRHGQEDTYFVTNNSKDFGKGSLLPQLQAEVDAISSPHAFHYLDGIEKVLDKLANRTGSGPNIEALRSSGPVVEAVASTWAGPDAFFELLGTIGLRGGERRPIALDIDHLLSGNAYQVDDRHFAAVISRWSEVSLIRPFGVASGLGPQHTLHTEATVTLLLELNDDGTIARAVVTHRSPLTLTAVEVTDLDEGHASDQGYALPSESE